MVEGSLVDIGDDQFSDQAGHKYRMVNVSNGHQMLYFGGSSFGWNAVSTAFTEDPASPDYDPHTEVLLYYSDFYGSAALEVRQTPPLSPTPKGRSNQERRLTKTGSGPT